MPTRKEIERRNKRDARIARQLETDAKELEIEANQLRSEGRDAEAVEVERHAANHRKAVTLIRDMLPVEYPDWFYDDEESA